MSDTSFDSASAGAGIDLSQFYAVFFEEAGENLARMEQLLLAIDVSAADDEELNAIFRCAHSIKGGAATFGFADVAELTHQMETLLDKLRRHELQPTAAMVDVLLQSGDALLEHFQAAVGRVEALAAAPGADAEALGGLREQLGGAVTALQFQDMASQLIAHTNQRLRNCADQLARDAFGPDADGEAVVAAAPLRPNPVTQDEMDAGSVELF